jgi:hypothetical protein
MHSSLLAMLGITIGYSVPLPYCVVGCAGKDSSKYDPNNDDVL